MVVNGREFRGQIKLLRRLFLHLEFFSFRSRSFSPHCSEHSAPLIVSKGIVPSVRCLGALAAVRLPENHHFCLFSCSLYFSRLCLEGVCGVQQSIPSPRALWVDRLTWENNSEGERSDVLGMKAAAHSGWLLVVSDCKTTRMDGWMIN